MLYQEKKFVLAGRVTELQCKDPKYRLRKHITMSAHSGFCPCLLRYRRHVSLFLIHGTGLQLVVCIDIVGSVIMYE